MTVLNIKTIMNYLHVEVRFWKLGYQKSVSLKPLFSFMSYLNVLKFCFYYKPYNRFEIITSSITNSVDLNQSKYKSNDTLKPKAYLHDLLGKEYKKITARKLCFQIVSKHIKS